MEIAIVGLGPRGLSVLERLCANERANRAHGSVTVHVIDPATPGPGAVWRPEQSRDLLTNTVASQITVYTDDSVRIDGPIEPGPSLYEWAKEVVASGAAEPRVLVEARALGPDSYPSRAFYGDYLRAAFQRVVANAPEHMTIEVHGSRAVAMADTNGVLGGPQGVRLEDGTRIHGLDVVVLALGHLPTKLSPREARAASLARIHGLTYVTPGNPADIDLGSIPAGETVLLRGLGLNFFDHMALFTIGRGGEFAVADGKLVYRPSGREPRLVATSRRGIPYHARGENEKGAYGRYFPRLLTPERVAVLRSEGSLAFTRQLWPMIAAEVECVYYETLLASLGRADESAAFAERYLADPDGREALVAGLGIEPSDRWSWELISQPYRDRPFTDRADFHGWLLEHLAKDVREARSGNVSGPLKAALDVLRDLRNEIRLAVDHSGLEGVSHRDDLDRWYTPLNAFLSIGPPVSRIEEMIALIEAGVLELTGPKTVISVDTGAEPAFVAESAAVPGPPVRSQVLIEARLPEPDVRRTTDPLVRHLLATEQIRNHVVDGYETGGLAVTQRPYRVINAEGEAHPRRFAYGVPTEAVHWVTAAGIRPGVDSVTLGDSDAIARAALAAGPVPRDPFPVLPEHAEGIDLQVAGVIV